MATATTKKMTMQDFIDWLKAEFAMYDKVVTRLKEEFGDEPHKFLSWGDDAFDHLAYRHWLAHFLQLAPKAMEQGETLEQFYLRHLQHLLSDIAMNSNRSTSPTGNLMNQCERQAKARILYKAQDGIKFNTFEL